MKKKILSILLIVTLALSLIACGSSSDSGRNSNEDVDVVDDSSKEETSSLAEGNFKGYSFIYDASYETQVSNDEKYFYLYPTANHAEGLIMLHYEETSIGNARANTTVFAENMTNSDNIIDVTYNYETEILDHYARRVVYTQIIDETEYTIDSYLIANGNEGIMYVGLCIPKDSDANYTDGFFKVLCTLEYNNGIPYPDKHIKEVTEQLENNIAYYDISLTYSDDWDKLNYGDQCDIVEQCIEYCTKRAALYGIPQNRINVFAYKASGQTIFSYDGGNEVRFYTDGKYDFNYYLE